MTGALGVSTRVQAHDWTDAIRAAGDVLVSLGCTSAGYTDAMIAGRAEFGPYMVIAPGIAMPHARPETGVIAPGVAIITLAEPIPFGHDTNDPVDLVIAFAALDKDEHLARLQWIAALAGDPTTLAAIRASSNNTQLSAALRAKEETP